MIRFFTAPSPNYDPDVNPLTPDGLVPVTGWYGVIGGFETTKEPDTPDSDDFIVGSNYSATFAVPEPGTTMLFLVGMGTIGLLRRRRKS